jgi:hypothetical protein
MVDDGNGNLVRACVKGGIASVESHGKQMAKDPSPETKKAKKFHPNPENEDGLNSRWQEEVLRRALQLKQALAQTGPEHMVQRIEEQLQQGPAGGFLEGLGAGRFGGYELGYTGGSDPDADKDAIRDAATQPEVVNAKRRCKKKLAVARALNIPTAPTGHI